MTDEEMCQVINTPLVTCRCSASDIACSSAITQEDLLCDACRIARQPGYTHCTAALKDQERTPHFALDLNLTDLRKSR